MRFLSIALLVSAFLSIWLSELKAIEEHSKPLSSSQNVNGKVKRRRKVRIKVFHYILPHWGIFRSGDYTCEKHVKCEWEVAASVNHLRLSKLYPTNFSSPIPTVTVGLYSIHSLWDHHRSQKPLNCQLPTNISMFETDESAVRFGWYNNQCKPFFDGFSSTSPHDDVQRVYPAALLNQSQFLPLRPFSALIKAGSYVASDCHRRDGANSHRDEVVLSLRAAGLRVDGLGLCLKTENIPEGISLPRYRRNHEYNIELKKEVINRYAFNLAYENSIEEGYVTEKVFDALVAGTVPVYLGDGQHLKTLIPHPKAVIFVQDFPSIPHLATYLQSLLRNETAYEEHRVWRQTFSFERNLANKPLLERSWQCRICHWAALQYQLSLQPQSVARGIVLAENQTIPVGAVSHRIMNRVCDDPNKWLLPKEKEGALYRPGDMQTIFLVRDGTLHAFPDFATFVAMGFDLSQVKVINPRNFELMIIGEDLPHKSQP